MVSNKILPALKSHSSNLKDAESCRFGDKKKSHSYTYSSAHPNYN
jgi:hypothetical protein